MTDIPCRLLLLIEDDPHQRRLVKHHLEGVVDEIRETGSGQHGVELAAALRPCVILLDMGLPDMDGLDVLRQLRERSLLDTTRVVVLSASRDMCLVVTALDGGAHDYILKPYTAMELQARLRSVFRVACLECRLRTVLRLNQP